MLSDIIGMMTKTITPNFSKYAYYPNAPTRVTKDLDFKTNFW